MAFLQKVHRSLYMSTEKKSFLLTICILGLIYMLAFCTRLFSVLRFESVIHEFDPYFNFRSTKYLAKHGWYKFYNWFDNFSWYPLGRIVGGTVYPGIQITAYILYRILHILNFTVDIRNVCVLTAPFFASNTAIVGYFLGNLVKGRGVGLLSAAMIGIIPGYISRSVAGSFDNEGVAIFALLITFTFFLKAVKTGSMMWSTGMCLCYFYMVNAWGGYIFILNLIPVYVVILIFFGYYSHRLYVAYSTFYALGTLLSMQVRFVGFQAVQTGEHMGALGIFVFLQFYSLVRWLQSLLSKQMFRRLVTIVVSALVVGAVSVFLVGTMTGYISPWSGRFYVMLDPTYAKKHIPIIASVSEHQPTTWASYFFDLHIAIFLFPVGIYFALKEADEMKIFMAVYGMFSVYFAGVMVRLVLVLAPAAAVLSSYALSQTLDTFMGILKGTWDEGTKRMKKRWDSWKDPAGGDDEDDVSDDDGIDDDDDGIDVERRRKMKQRQRRLHRRDRERRELIQRRRVERDREKKLAARRRRRGEEEEEELSCEISVGMIVGITVLLMFFVFHCAWVTSEAYSSPSIVLAARGQHGRILFDDFREAYFWISQNTPEDAKVMSWWDYGYQITAMANRTIIVDNNTWNNSHIATVGRAMSSIEPKAYKIMQKLDVSYVLVIFGGVTGFASDDINKFLWMVRIGGSVYPEIKEKDYLTPRGEYRIDVTGTKTMLNSLMYKMSYYRFDEMMTEQGKPLGYDRVRHVEIGKKGFGLEYLEEAYSSEHFIVRVYKVKEEQNLQSNNFKVQIWPHPQE